MDRTVKLPPAVLAEVWMPIAQVGAECMRERGASSALPPLYFLHVWWARRPLTISRAAILGSLLPLWHKGWPTDLLELFPTEESYRNWFLKVIGILGDPAVVRKLITQAKVTGENLGPNPYGYKRAFTRSPEQDQLEALGRLLEYTWGTRDLVVCDPMAGGGSIPFEALRYGFRTYANELNAVASVILKATLDYPARLGPGFADEINKWGDVLARRVRERLEPFFPKGEGESIHAYLWARTVACPTTGKPVPLSPNWWSRKGSDAVAVKLIAEPDDDVCRFEIVEGKEAAAAEPDEGTVKSGVGRSPWTGDAVPGDYIKAEAQAGRMGQQLYAVCLKVNRGVSFRVPTVEDIKATQAAEEEVTKNSSEWYALGLLPLEPRTEGRADWATAIYGIKKWKDTYCPRQLLAMVTFLQELSLLRKEIPEDQRYDYRNSIITMLGLAIDKAADYNSRQTVWHPSRTVIGHTFTRHDFSFKWSHAEFDAAANLLPWAVDQVADAYKGIAELSKEEIGFFAGAGESGLPIQLTKGNAASLPDIADGSVHAVVVDPPYGDNVMYAECSDFFYVWSKRTVGDLFPGWFDEELTNKDDEAVVNFARFRGEKNRDKLAKTDYERKMAACFREMHRILRDDGVLTVMFTHKEVETWDTLASSLIGAGFSIKTSWPIHTESEHSLHQAKKNAAKSTILLVCRKREPQDEPTWWDEIKGKVRAVAREKARYFHGLGISGVDLYISTFGPVLAVLSHEWPVLSAETDGAGKPLPLRPEVALDLAREEVVALRKEELLLGRKVQFDPVTDWYLLAWDAFKAERFPGDEARKLAIVLGLNLEKDLISAKRVVSKKSADVVLRLPKARKKKGMVDADVDAFDSWSDAAHTAMLVYEEDGARACEEFLKATGLLGDSTFKLVLQAMMSAIPRTRGKKGAFNRPEAAVLEDIRLKFFEDIAAPPEEELPKIPTQEKMYESGEEEEETEEEGPEEE